MYCYKDNFLSDEVFNLFKEDILNKYEPRKEWIEENGELRFGKHVSGENYKEDAPVRVGLDLTYPEDTDYMHTAVRLGSKSLPKIARSIKQYMIEDMNLINPLARMMWYQYHSNKKHGVEKVRGSYLRSFYCAQIPPKRSDIRFPMPINLHLYTCSRQ